MMTGDCTGPRSAEFVLKDPTIDFAVLESARGGILKNGLAFSNCDIAVITNVTEDHIGLGNRTIVEAEVTSMRYRGTRWRRATVTQNFHWRAAMQARCGNWLLGRGFYTTSDGSHEAEEERQCSKINSDHSKDRRINTAANFTIVCTCCGKHFKRRSATATMLRAHKSPSGFTCCGTIGYFQ